MEHLRRHWGWAMRSSKIGRKTVLAPTKAVRAEIKKTRERKRRVLL